MQFLYSSVSISFFLGGINRSLGISSAAYQAVVIVQYFVFSNLYFHIYQKFRSLTDWSFTSYSYTASEIDLSSDKTPEQRALLVESRRCVLFI